MIGIEISGLQALIKYSQKLKKEYFSSFKKAGMIGVRDIQQHFRNSQGEDNKWKALEYRSGKPLQITGALQQSIAEAVHSDNTVEIGTNLKYARVHNFGATIKPVKKEYLTFKIGDSYRKCKQVVIPQREFMWISEDADDKITAVLTDSWEKL